MLEQNCSVWEGFYFVRNFTRKADPRNMKNAQRAKDKENCMFSYRKWRRCGWVWQGDTSVIRVSDESKRAQIIYIVTYIVIQGETKAGGNRRAQATEWIFRMCKGITKIQLQLALGYSTGTLDVKKQRCFVNKATFVGNSWFWKLLRYNDVTKK